MSSKKLEALSLQERMQLGTSIPAAKPSSTRWTREEMLAAGIPEDRLGAAPLFDTLEEAAAALSPSAQKSSSKPPEKP